MGEQPSERPGEYGPVLEEAHDWLRKPVLKGGQRGWHITVPWSEELVNHRNRRSLAFGRQQAGHDHPEHRVSHRFEV
jgi:hypothetical protein